MPRLPSLSLRSFARPYLLGCSLLGLAIACGSPQTSPTANTSAHGSAAPAVSGAIAAHPVEITPAARAIVDAADRSESDKKLDAGRHSAEMLSFLGLTPGMRVAEIAAGGGYTTELLARAVGPNGKVYGQNSPAILERFAQKPWTERLAKPVMQNVVRLDREFDEPFPADVHDLDAVLSVLFYHDMFWLGVDREKMNRAVYNALLPGGLYVVVDHSGRVGTGASEVKTLHRVDEGVVRAEIEKAGFRLAREGSFLRNPADTRDWNDSPSSAGDRRGTSDRFVLVYKKP